MTSFDLGRSRPAVYQGRLQPGGRCAPPGRICDTAALRMYSLARLMIHTRRCDPVGRRTPRTVNDAPNLRQIDSAPRLGLYRRVMVLRYDLHARPNARIG